MSREKPNKPDKPAERLPRQKTDYETELEQTINTVGTKQKSTQPDDGSWGPWAAFLVSIVSFIAPQILLGFLIGLYAVIFGLDLDAIFNENSIVANFIFIILFEGLGVITLFMIMKTQKYDIGLLKIKRPSFSQMMNLIPAFGVYFILTFTFAIILASLASEGTIDQDQITGFDDPSGSLEYVLAFVALVIVAPLVEELIFRGFLFRGLRRRYSFTITALITALLFGLVHLQLNVGVDTFALGLVLAYLVEKTDNLWPAIGLHALKNFVAFMLLFVIDIS